MEKTELRIVWIDDDQATVFLDGDYLGRITYDALGREGMNIVEHFLTRIAERKDWDLRVDNEEFQHEK